MKMERPLIAAVAVLACAGVFAISDGGRLAANAATAGALLGQLKSGGYVIYLRHSMTDTTRDDADPIDIKDCSTQRPLSDAGRALARKIGEAFAAAQLPVGRIVSSPYCRALETAAIVFPGLTRTTSDALWYSLALSKDQAERDAAELKAMLATRPQAGTDTVIVGHTSNLQEAAGIWPKKEGGATVFRPDGHGAFAFVGSIDPADIVKSAE